MQSEDEDLTISNEWKYIALIIDRLLLYIYCFLAVFGTFYFFWSIGNNSLQLKSSTTPNLTLSDDKFLLGRKEI